MEGLWILPFIYKSAVVKFITRQLELVDTKHIFLNSLCLTKLDFNVNTSLSFQAVIE